MTTPDTPLHPAELSAYLDGELPRGRVLEIEALLARDPALRAEYEALLALDLRWRQASAGAVFAPEVEFAPVEASPGRLASVAAVVLALLMARGGGKFIEALAPSLLLNLVALALACWAVLAAVRADAGRA